jgi:hypothetical protein
VAAKPYRIQGQVLLLEKDAEPLSVSLRPRTGRSRRQRPEATGEFLFDEISPGSYVIVIKLRSGEIVLPGIELP